MMEKASLGFLPIVQSERLKYIAPWLWLPMNQSKSFLFEMVDECRINE
jgi:hypothetical protein